jgi:hypothetical protein
MAYKGWTGTTDQGTPCYVINADTTRYKVILGTSHGYAGDHAVKQIVSYTGKTGWIAKAKVTRVKR